MSRLSLTHLPVQPLSRKNF